MHFHELNLSKAMVADLLPSCPQKSFQKNEILFFKDDPGLETYFIETGSAKAISLAADGKSVFFADYMAGDIFGYYATITKKSRTATIIAQTPVTVRIIPEDQFINFITTNPVSAREMILYLTTHLRFNSLRMSRNFTMSAPERVAAFLIFTSEEQGRDTIDIDNREDFASQMNITRETLSRILHKFVEDGLIALDAWHIRILNAQGLYKLFAAEE